MSAHALPPLAISMGEPAGIGPDLILQLYEQRKAIHLPAFIVYGSTEFLKARARQLNFDITVSPSTPKDAAEQFDFALPVVDMDAHVENRAGELREETAKFVIHAISVATEHVLCGKCRGLVTAPIQKAILYGAGFNHPGHTEFLAELCAREGETPTPVMMLAHEELRAVPVTIHVPISKVSQLLTKDLIVETAQIVDRDMKTRFGIVSPKLAIAGLNPHAGENATIGLEDRDVVAPAVAELVSLGINAVGPLSADTLFHLPHWRKYDVVIAMYHDQALIPIKTVAFDEGVNVTLGLPIVRTSPDHGTALDLAGTGSASPKSMLAAIRLADQMTGGM